MNRELVAGPGSGVAASAAVLACVDPYASVLPGWRAWNATETVHPGWDCIHVLFDRAAFRYPSKTAVRCGGRQLSYQELNSRANGLAASLRNAGQGPGSVIGVGLPRGIDAVVAMLAVLKCGAAYLPLDPSLPDDRLEFMLAEANVSVVITDGVDQPIPATRLDEISTPDDLAYVIFTSGSTGRPKGAMLPHAGVVNWMLWMRRAFDVTESDSIMWKAVVGFDHSVWECFLPLITGATLVIAESGREADWDYLSDLIESGQVTMMQFVPSVLGRFVDQTASDKCRSLRHVMSGGEALSPNLVRRFYEKIPQCELCNAYGPTEASIGVTMFPCPRAMGTDFVPIGRPIDNVKIHILDQSMQPVPAGEAGELYIQGGLARGYVNRPDLTAERFVKSPFDAQMLYRTGDLAAWLPDGNLRFIGRVDNQVKIRGLRIELEEVEAVLKRHPEVLEAAATVSGQGERASLWCYFKRKPESDLRKEDVRAYLESRLPAYMAPSRIVEVDRFPLIDSGKVDRRALAGLESIEEKQVSNTVDPISAGREAVVNFWRDLLQVSHVGLHDDFYDLGGNSLLFSVLVAFLRKQFGPAVPADPRKSRTVSAILEYLNNAHRAPAVPTSLADLLRIRALERSSQTVYQFLRNGEEETEPVTYGSLYARARAVASLLRGLPPAARVILIFPSGPEFIQAFFGCLEAGVIPVALPPPRARGRGIEGIACAAKDCDAAAVLTSEPLLARMRSYLPDFPALNALKWLKFEDSEGILPRDSPLPGPSANSIAFLQYTSGSTGNPKGVAVSHQNVLDNQRLLQIAFSHTSDTVIAGWLPHYHDMGLVGMLLHPLYLGSRCVLLSPEAFLQEPGRWLRAMARFRAHTSVAPTFAYELAADRIQALPPETDLRCWQVAIVGAEPVRRKTLEGFADKFAPWGFRRSAFYPCYGLAEATLFVTGARWDCDVDGADHWTMGCGPAAGYQDVRIVDPQRRIPVAAGEMGEIWVGGPSVASGYWNRPAETNERFSGFLENGDGPFLRTQDLGWLSHGRLIVAGRLRNIIIINGRNYFAEDIEAALCGRAAAFAVSGEEGERLMVLQEINPDKTDGLDADAVCQSIQRALGETVGITAHAIVLVRYGAIPRTTSGKVRYAECPRMLADGSLTPLATRTFERALDSPIADSDPAPRDRDSIEDWLVERVARRLKVAPQEISRFDTFAALGLQSIDIIEITEELARTLNVFLDPTMFWEFPSIAEAARGLEQAINP